MKNNKAHWWDNAFWKPVRRSLWRSTWVTGSWNWFLGLVSRAAEGILTITILYSTLQIFTNTSPQVDLVMFLAQQLALDAGGAGLIKLANMAKKDGQVEGAKKARNVAMVLFALMGVGVITAQVESKLSLTTIINHHTVILPFKQAYPLATLIIEIILLCARGTMAVVYGFVIHDLESEMPEQPPALDVQALVNTAIVDATTQLENSQKQMMSDLSARFEQAANLQRIEQQRLLTTVQEVKNTQQTLQIAGPGGSQEEIVNTVLDRLQTLFVEQQEAKQTRQLATSTNVFVEGSTNTQIAKPRPRTQTTHPEISKRPKRIDPDEVDAIVHPLLNKDRSLTHRKIAALPGVTYTETVVYASVKRWREKQPVVSGDLPETAEGEVS